MTYLNIMLILILILVVVFVVMFDDTEIFTQEKTNCGPCNAPIYDPDAEINEEMITNKVPSRNVLQQEFAPIYYETAGRTINI